MPSPPPPLPYDDRHVRRIVGGVSPVRSMASLKTRRRSDSTRRALRRITLATSCMKAGYNYHGNEPMYSGITGEELACDIYIGVVYYQRLPTSW